MGDTGTDNLIGILYFSSTLAQSLFLSCIYVASSVETVTVSKGTLTFILA